MTTAFFLLAWVFSGNLYAAGAMQDNLRETVYGPNNPKTRRTKKTAGENVKTKKPPVTKVTTTVTKVTTPFTKVTTTPGRRTTGRRISTGSNAKTFVASAARELIDVTFTARQPNSEIWLNDKNIGLTDGNSVLSKKLAPNNYRVMVRKSNQVVFPSKIISVSAEQADFMLFNETAVSQVPEPAAVISAPQQEEKSGDDLTNEELSAKVKEIFDNYVDPAKTDSVSREDWELVFKFAQLGYVQDFTAVQMDAQRWLASGQIELAKQNYNYAFAAFKKAVDFMPKSPLPFYGLGNTYLADNQPAEALKAFQQAAAYDPKMAMIYKKIGDAQRLLRNKKESLAAYKNAVLLGYTVPETRYWLAVTLIENERTKEGLTQLEELAELTPTAEIFVAIGDAYGQLKQNVSAVEFYRKAIEDKPDLAVAYYKLGNIYLNERGYPKAKESFEKAVELDPEGKTFNLPDAKKKVREASSKIK